MSYEIKFADVSDAKVNNLEGDSLDDGAIPPFWTPEHVKLRLIEAFQMDARLPRVKTPKAPGGSHPAIGYTREEMDEMEREPARFKPSLLEIAVMEKVFDWLLIVRDFDTGLYFSLRAWLINERKRRDGSKFVRPVRALSGQLGTKAQTLLDRKERSLRLISSRLNALSTPVF